MSIDRPTVGRLVVPFMVDATLSPIDFRMLDARHVTACAMHRWCGICGHWIRRGDYAFIGPDDDRTCFADPWMHRACAAIALDQCPFLAGRRDWRDPAAYSDELLAPYARMVLRHAQDGRAHRDALGAWHFEAVRFVAGDPR